MFALLYTSSAVTKFSDEDLSALYQQSAKNNFKLNVTGYLYFRHGNFFQYIEGEEQTVIELMERIERDNRHTITQILYDKTLVEHRFPEWSMQYLHLDGVLYEDVIMGHLKLLKLSNFIKDIEQQIWDSVNKLSHYRDVLVHAR